MSKSELDIAQEILFFLVFVEVKIKVNTPLEPNIEFFFLLTNLCTNDMCVLCVPDCDYIVLDCCCFQFLALIFYRGGGGIIGGLMGHQD